MVVDLETTGGSPGMSKVTEIGAVRVRGPAGGRALRDAGGPGPAHPAGHHRADRDRRRDGGRAAGHRGGARALRRLLRRGRAGGAQRAVRPALPQLRAAPARRALLHPALAGHARPVQAPARAGGWSATTCAPSPSGPTPRCARATARCRTPRRRPSCWSRCWACWPSAATTRSSARSRSARGAGRATRTSSRWPRTCPPARASTSCGAAAGEVLYVGKAGNLRRRVRAYFGPGGRHGRRIGRVLADLDRVDHELCGSEFEALLRESELLRDLRPPGNHRGVGLGGVRYLKLSLGEPYPRIYAVPRPADDGAAYFGPLRSDRLVRLALEALHALLPLRACHPLCGEGRQTRLLYPDAARCAGPCAGGDPEAYAEAVGQARRAARRRRRRGPRPAGRAGRRGRGRGTAHRAGRPRAARRPGRGRGRPGAHAPGHGPATPCWSSRPRRRARPTPSSSRAAGWSRAPR